MKLQKEINSNIIIVEDFNTLLKALDSSSRQINKATTPDQMNLTDISRTFYPTTAEYTFFSLVHASVFKIDHTLCHKISIDKL